MAPFLVGGSFSTISVFSASVLCCLLSVPRAQTRASSVTEGAEAAELASFVLFHPPCPAVLWGACRQYTFTVVQT